MQVRPVRCVDDTVRTLIARAIAPGVPMSLESLSPSCGNLVCERGCQCEESEKLSVRLRPCKEQQFTDLTPVGKLQGCDVALTCSAVFQEACAPPGKTLCSKAHRE